MNRKERRTIRGCSEIFIATGAATEEARTWVTQ